jgi:hypothetical protein
MGCPRRPGCARPWTTPGPSHDRPWAPGRPATEPPPKRRRRTLGFLAACLLVLVLVGRLAVRLRAGVGAARGENGRPARGRGPASAVQRRPRPAPPDGYLLAHLTGLSPRRQVGAVPDPHHPSPGPAAGLCHLGQQAGRGRLQPLGRGRVDRSSGGARPGDRRRGGRPEAPRTPPSSSSSWRSPPAPGNRRTLPEVSPGRCVSAGEAAVPTTSSRSGRGLFDVERLILAADRGVAPRHQEGNMRS